MPASKRVAPLGAAALAVASFAFAADRKPLTVEDIWSVRRVGTPVLSPDGKTVACTVATYEMDENRSNADVWLVPVAGGPARRLTTGKTSETSPVWSPDGRRLAFVSKREGDAASQLYLLPLNGGEAERLTEMPLGVSNPARDLRRAHREGRPRPAGVLPGREPLGPEGAELEALVRRGPGLAGPLAEMKQIPG
jgi:tricorn protease-like protein